MTSNREPIHNHRRSSHPKSLLTPEGCPFPVGVEYYRAPVPDRAYWEEDFKRIRRAGMRIVRAFHPWNWVETKPGEFYFDDLDYLFDLAVQNDLKVWLDTPVGTHMACPDWMLPKHPDMCVERYDGSRAYPRSGTCAPQGLMIHNFDHPMWRVYVERYIRALIGRYKDNPAMYVWGTWDGINFAAAWSARPSGQDFPPYNDYTIAKYVAWLQQQYTTLEALNDRLLRRYASWDDVKPPRDNRGFVEMLLYRRFHYENCADHLGWLADLIDQIDGQHEQRSHGAPFPRQFDLYCSPRVDSWGLSHSSFSQLRSDTPSHRIADNCLGFTWSRCVGRNHRWWNEEIYSGFVGGIHQPNDAKQTLPQEVQLYLWLSLIYGAAGAMYWQYRPEYMTFEAPGLNLTSLDGRPTARLDAIADTISDIQRLGDHLPLPPISPGQLAIVYDPTNHDIFMCGDDEEGYIEALLAMHRSLWPKNIDQDVVTVTMDWSFYKAIYLPHFARQDATSAQKIRQLIECSDGPHFIADGHFGTFAERGHWSYNPPELLGDLLPVRLDDFDSVMPDEINRQSDRRIFKSIYGDIEIQTPCQYAILHPLEGAEVLGTIDGQVVAVRCAKQRFTWFGFPLSALAQRGAITDATSQPLPDVANATPRSALAQRGAITDAILQPLLDAANITPTVKIAGDPLVAFQRNSKLGGRLIFLMNLYERTAESIVTVSPTPGRAYDLLGRQELAIRDGSFSVTLAFGQVMVIHSPEQT